MLDLHVDRPPRRHHLERVIYFTSDHHFGHANILKYCKRPFEDIESHDQELIDNWNSVVDRGDVVYHLGDFALAKPDYIKKLASKLNGSIHLILGNHDRSLKKSKQLQSIFASCSFYKEIKVADEEMDLEQPIVMMHYPIESWNKRHHGSWHLHGHCHGTLPSADYQARLDVGVDCHGFTPISYEEVKELMTKKVFKPIDHHVDRSKGK